MSGSGTWDGYHVPSKTVSSVMPSSVGIADLRSSPAMTSISRYDMPWRVVATRRDPLRLLGYCLMINHFPLLLRPVTGQSIGHSYRCECARFRRS